MPVHLTQYERKDSAVWDAFVEQTHSGTILHSRRFLDYHGERFHDESLCVWRDPGVRLNAVIPLARSKHSDDIVVSHPGSTFGGLLSIDIDPAERFNVLRAAARHLLDRGYRTMIYTPVPAIFGGQMDESDLRIFTAISRPLQCDLWSFIRLDRPYRFSAKRKASVKSSKRKGISTRPASGDAEWVAFHAMLCANLAERHDVSPVHTLAEMLDLRDRLEMASQLWLSLGPDGDIVAGSWCLAYNKDTLHTQYISSTSDGRNLGAVDCLLSDIVEQAVLNGFKTVSFGISTLADGYSINTGLLKQKLRFGSGIAVHWKFQIALQDLCTVEAGFS